jgi:tetratricopeptide (TPR) repeat protein
VAALCLTACAPAPAALRQPPPVQASPAADWQYGVYLLSVQNDPAAAQQYLARVPAEGGVPDPEQASLLYRDLAEARLFAGDLSGAAEAARIARDQLDRRPTTAQFQADDRSLFARDVSALAAAGAENLDQLSEIANSIAGPPDADTWYLLGWARERSGDLPGAQAAYRKFLELAPGWSFLRTTSAMQRHARQAVGGP